MLVDVKKVCEIISKISETISVHKDELTELDGPIGDSDHGINMARGFEAVRSGLSDLEGSDVATVLKKCGRTLVSQVGGSSGPLYGTAFMKAGAALKDVDAIGLEDFSRAFAAAIEGVMSRGRSTTGEKTMLDAMVPAQEAIVRSLEQGATCEEALRSAALAASEGAESTIPMVATKGRASYLGERSVGHKDPGAASFAYIMQAIAESVR